MSEREDEPLTAEDETGLRAVIDQAIADDYHYHPLTVKMLLATLDAERAAHVTSLWIEGTAVAERDRLAAALSSPETTPAPDAGPAIDREDVASEIMGLIGEYGDHASAFSRTRVLADLRRLYDRLALPQPGEPT